MEAAIQPFLQSQSKIHELPNTGGVYDAAHLVSGASAAFFDL